MVKKRGKVRNNERRLVDRLELQPPDFQRMGDELTAGQGQETKEQLAKVR